MDRPSWTYGTVLQHPSLSEFVVMFAGWVTPGTVPSFSPAYVLRSDVTFVGVVMRDETGFAHQFPAGHVDLYSSNTWIVL